MRCCFTGHRHLTDEEIQVIQYEILSAVEPLADENKDCQFLVGGALGFDTIAAEAVLFFREVYPQIRLILALPCYNQTKGWPAKDIFRYNNIRKKADEVIYISKEYYNGCMLQRDRYLVEHSDICIAFLRPNTQKGGTRYTVDYCLERGIPVVNIAQRGIIFPKGSQMLPQVCGSPSAQPRDCAVWE